MISRIKNSVFSRILWGFMGLYLLNISVDPADLKPEHTPEYLSFNEQESILEIVVEKVLGFEDAIYEYDDPDTEDHNFKVFSKIILFAQQNAETDNHWLFLKTAKQKFPFYSSFVKPGFQNLETPPPQV